MVKKKVCIATADLAELVRNSGVGTAYSSLAMCLSKEFDVTILFCAAWSEEDEWFYQWQSYFEGFGIRLLTVRDPSPAILGSQTIQRSYIAYLHLKREHFDVIHFPDYLGIGYFSTLAKKTGCAFQKTQIVTILNGPHEWIHRYSNALPSTPEDLEIYFLERESVKMSDHVIAPSKYALEWVLQNGWELPKSQTVLFYPLPRLPKKRRSAAKCEIDEIVFFGRLETRKGIQEFVSAIDQLADDFLEQKTVTFLGRSGIVDGVPSGEYLRKLRENPRLKLRFIENFNQQEAIEYLSRASRLAVIPSHAETLGYTVIECARAQVKFIASDIPPFREMFPGRANQHLFFKLNGKNLSERIVWASKQYHRPGDVRYTQAVNKKWVRWHSDICGPVIASNRPAENDASKTKISVIVTHKDRLSYLKEAIESIRRQTHENTEIIVCDDHSAGKEVRRYLAKLRAEGIVVYQADTSRGPGFLRNEGAKLASGKWLMFMDDDNLAKPQELETFLRASFYLGADLLTCPMDIFKEIVSNKPKVESTWVPLGPDPISALLYNVFGDMNCFVKREVFMTVGGISEIRGVSHEDYDFFMRALSKGFKLCLVPEPLFFYRFQEDSYSKSISQDRTLAFRIESVSKVLGFQMKGLAPLLFAWKFRLQHAEGPRTSTGGGFVNPHRIDKIRVNEGLPKRLVSLGPLALKKMLKSQCTGRSTSDAGLVWTKSFKKVRISLPKMVQKRDFLGISFKVLSPAKGRVVLTFPSSKLAPCKRNIEPGINHLYIEFVKPEDARHVILECSQPKIGISALQFYGE